VVVNDSNFQLIFGLYPYVAFVKP